MTEFNYTAFENIVTCQKLKEDMTCKVIGIGNSMAPILKSRKPVICVPVKKKQFSKRKILFFVK